MKASLATGFVGGILATLISLALVGAPQPDKDHPLFEAPFLGFLGVVLLVAIFYHPLRTLLSRGALTVKWGDKEISITEIEDSIDTELSELQSRIATLQEDLESLKQQAHGKVEAAQPQPAEPEAQSSVILQAIRNTFPEATSDELASLIFHLGTSTYKWRNQTTLAKRTNLSMGAVDDLVLSAPQLIIRSRSKTGNTIHRLAPPAKARLHLASR